MHAYEISTNSNGGYGIVNSEGHIMTPSISSNNIRLHPINRSKPTIGWSRIFIIMSHQIYGRLLTHQTLFLCIITGGRGLVVKVVNKHPNNTKSSLMEATARAMEDINKDHLIKAYTENRPDIWDSESEIKLGEAPAWLLTLQ
ncbi:hypothetical protein ACTXT7_003699 [Hymenolepis weldensis]